MVRKSRTVSRSRREAESPYSSVFLYPVVSTHTPNYPSVGLSIIPVMWCHHWMRDESNRERVELSYLGVSCRRQASLIASSPHLIARQESVHTCM